MGPMPSGLNRILPRMRISRDALRVSALVAAGITSGYLWRAALEPPREARTVIAPPQIVSDNPFVRIPGPANPPPTSGLAARRTPTAPGTTPVSRSTSRSAARAPEVRKPPTPTPPKPAPQPPVPAPTPTPAPTTPPPSTAPATATPSQPTVAAAPPNPPSPPAQQPPPSTQQPTPSTQPPPSNEESRDRPGWGHGDKNHDHSGPGHENEKGGKKNG